MKLREYQTEAIEAAEKALAEGRRRVAVVLPTGAGKTVVFAHLIARRVEADPQGRIVVLVHRDELAQQAAAKLAAILPPGVTLGIVKAELDEVEAQVVVASVPTLANLKRLNRLREVTTVVVDECHHATAVSYTVILKHFGCFDELRPGIDDGDGAVAVGFTATMQRGDGMALGKVWEEIAYTKDVLWMIRRGFLADVEGKQVAIEQLDLDTVGRSAGDYAPESLSAALEASMAPETVAKAYDEHGRRPDGSLRPGISFAPTVASAHLFAEAFEAAGIRTAVVHGAMPTPERRAVLDDFEHGRLDVISNCMVLTEGFDSPRAEVCVLARPTTSAPLYVQMVGRVLRPYPGKARALVLDVVGAAGRHVLATLATLAGVKARPPKEGQSLLEAIEEQAAEGISEILTVWAQGPTTVEAVDLFGGSRQQWLRTKAGHWFLPAGDRAIIIYDGRQPGTFDVASYAKAGGGGRIARGVPDLGYAMAAGEETITSEEDALSRKAGRWRKAGATKVQVGKIEQLGMGRGLTAQQLEELGRGEASDLISIGVWSPGIDRVVGNLLSKWGRG